MSLCFDACGSVVFLVYSVWGMIHDVFVPYTIVHYTACLRIYYSSCVLFTTLLLKKLSPTLLLYYLLQVATSYTATTHYATHYYLVATVVVSNTLQHYLDLQYVQLPSTTVLPLLP
jgi:hypothetical protein